MDNTTDLIHLQINGKNQLKKEIEETNKLSRINLHPEATHRNEITGETENPKIHHNEMLFRSIDQYLH